MASKASTYELDSAWEQVEGRRRELEHLQTFAPQLDADIAATESSMRAASGAGNHAQSGLLENKVRTLRARRSLLPGDLTVAEHALAKAQAAHAVLQAAAKSIRAST